VPVYNVRDGGAEIEIAVLSMRELRGPLRARAEGKAIARAKLQAVEALLAET